MIEQLEKIVKEIAIDLYEYNNNLSIYLFGSSMVNNNGIGKDIDILMLENVNNTREKFRANLLKMQKEFIDHGTPFSFSTYNKSIDCIFDKSLKVINRKNEIKLYTKFVFGPLDQAILPTQKERFFHIKGPIFVDEFIFFCRSFPFHAKSIIHNNKRLIGNYDISCLDKYITINENDYATWLNSLKMRSDKSQCPIELNKLIKKLIYTYLIYKNKLPINESLINDVLKKFNVKINNNRNTIYLKGIFDKLFKCIELK